MPTRQETEAQRRRRQVKVITEKIESAIARKDQPAADAARVALEATQARLHELEAQTNPEPPRSGRR